MTASPLKIFSLDAGAPLADAVAGELGIERSAHEERDFADGEHKLRPLDDVEAADVYVVQSLYGAAGSSVDDKLIRLLFFIATLRDVGAHRVTAVVPYLCYGRKDRRTKLRDPLSSRYLASLFEAMGADAVVTLDAHNQAAFENAFRCRTLHLLAQPLLLDFAANRLRDETRPLVVASPDVGGVKRAEALRTAMGERLGREIGRAFVEKYRSGGQLSGGTLVGDVRDAAVLVVDDLISGGGTIERAVTALRDAGAAKILVTASHGQFSGDARERLSPLSIDAIAVTDSLPQPAPAGQIAVLSSAPLLAEAIRRLHGGGPACELSL
ncbi:ribose-phosphate pyrophosphokinase [Microbulbifer flavimaris]|uniref:ribose-phosphate diphosphokinase n=2 Tax=Microbulbiferaceae TaxID=1706373 RepID=A0ABX4HYK2_9GAMM|nr:ribose-phosphate pyrophosphokinase [Microbulbifer sp. ZGT114]PCO05225.1 ribose-phosphate pyrophosphokinase [Microbulbifer flavimaris]